MKLVSRPASSVINRWRTHVDTQLQYRGHGAEFTSGRLRVVDIFTVGADGREYRLQLSASEWALLTRRVRDFAR